MSLIPRSVSRLLMRYPGCLVPLAANGGGATMVHCRGMAGHSKWSNIRHIKSAKDSEKQKVALMAVNRLKVVAREGGSTNPKHNYMLARAVEDAKSKDVPKSTIENALKSMAATKEKGAKLYVEAKGIGNCMLIIETFTDNPRRTRQEIQTIMKRYRGTIGDSGLAAHNYEYKGVIYAPVLEPVLSADEATEVAIDVGAEEVMEDVDEEGHNVLRFITDPQQLHSVKREVDEHMQTSAARLEYIPVTLIELTEPHLQLVLENLSVLADLGEVVRVFDNISNPTPE